MLEKAAEIALTHHEKCDGTGYPNGLKSEDIPLEGKIAAVADVFDAISTDRIYRKAFTLGESVEIMKEGRGSHFDPEIVDLFLDSLDEILVIKDANE
jgi:putative two-component system response regulator